MPKHLPARLLLPCIFSIFLMAHMAAASPVIVSEIQQELVPAKGANGLWGYVDAKSLVFKIPPAYAGADFFMNGLAVVTVRGEAQTERALLINHLGETVLGQGAEPPLASITRAQLRDQRLGGAAFSKSDRLFGRVFLVETSGLRGVYHADHGWLLRPVRDFSNAYFYSDTSFTYGGGVIVDAKPVPVPKGFKVRSLDVKNRFVFLAEDKELSLKEAVSDMDGKAIVPDMYNEITWMEEPRVFLCSKLPDFLLSRVMVSVVTGRDFKLSEDKDYVNSDVLDEKGNRLHSIASHEKPFGKDATISYESKGRRFLVNARDGRPVEKVEEAGDGLVIFTLKDQAGLKDSRGKTLIAPDYAELTAIGNGLFIARKSPEHYKPDNYGLLDQNGRVVIPFAYEKLEPIAYKGGKPDDPLRYQKRDSNSRMVYGLISRDGKLVTPEMYDGGFYFDRSGLAVVYKDGRHGVIDKKGRQVIPCVYKTIFDVAELNDVDLPLFVVEKDRLWGIMNGKGETVLEPEYGFVSYEKDSRDFGHWFRLEDPERNKQGGYRFVPGTIIPPVYNSMRFYPDSVVAWTRQENENKEFYTLLSTTGKELGKYKRLERSRFTPAVYQARQDDGAYGLVGADGKPVTGFKYERTFESNPVYFLVEDQQGRSFYIDRKGREYLPKE